MRQTFHLRPWSTHDIKTPFTREPNRTGPNGTVLQLVRIGLAFTRELLEPFQMELLSVLFSLRYRSGSIWNRSVWLPCKQSEPNGTEPEESGEGMRLFCLGAEANGK